MAEWIEYRINAWDNPKFRDLAEILDISKKEAIGSMFPFWAWVWTNKFRGILEGRSIEVKIAHDGAKFDEKDAQRVVDAMVEARFIHRIKDLNSCQECQKFYGDDNLRGRDGYVAHDWDEYTRFKRKWLNQQKHEREGNRVRQQKKRLREKQRTGNAYDVTPHDTGDATRDVTRDKSVTRNGYHTGDIPEAKPKKGKKKMNDLFGDKIPETKKTSPQTRLIDLWKKRFFEETGRQSTTGGKRLAGTFTRLMKIDDEQIVQLHVTNFFNSTDPYVKKAKFSFDLFERQYDRLADGPLLPRKSGKDGGDGGLDKIPNNKQPAGWDSDF